MIAIPNNRKVMTLFLYNTQQGSGRLTYSAHGQQLWYSCQRSKIVSMTLLKKNIMNYYSEVNI